jgi:hypothetical protein
MDVKLSGTKKGSFEIEVIADDNQVYQATLSTKNKGVPEPLTPKKTETLQQDKVALWGDDNQFPNIWEAQVEANDILIDAVEKEIDRIYAGGIEVGYEEVVDGERHFVSWISPEIEDWLHHPITENAYEQTIRDYVIHRLPAPELIFDSAKIRCLHISGQKAQNLRWQIQNESGVVENAYINANWHLSRRSDSPDSITVPVIDPLIHGIEVIRKEKYTNYIYRTPIATGRTYYPLTPAYAAVTSHSVEIYSLTNETLKSIIKNQMTVKYHIEVDRSYFEEKYKEKWTKSKPDERNAIIKEELEIFNKMLHGTLAAGRNVMTIKEINHKIGANGTEYSLWKITELKGNVFDKSYIELLSEVRGNIQRAVGIDPTLQGSTKSGMGAGSGSDKREAFNIKMNTATRHVTNIQSPFYWAMRFNGWKAPNGGRILLRSIVPNLQTLNDVAPDKRDTTMNK